MIPSGADIKNAADEKEKRAKGQLLLDRCTKPVFLFCAAFSVLAIISIFLYLLVAAIPGIAKVGFFNFIFGTTWKPTDPDLADSEKFGILPMIVGSLYVVVGSGVIGIVFGVLSAVFIAKFCPKKIKGAIKQIINLLAGLPSVIYGFFGMVVIVPNLWTFAQAIGIKNRVTGNGVMACSIILGIMILPTIISLSVNAIEAQPKSYYDGALALGAKKEQAIFKVLLPGAKSGILASIVLGLGRALGETMAVLMVCGASPVFPESIFHNMRTLTVNVVLELGYADGLHRDMLIATGFVLLVFILLLTSSVNLLRRKK